MKKSNLTRLVAVTVVLLVAVSPVLPAMSETAGEYSAVGVVSAEHGNESEHLIRTQEASYYEANGTKESNTTAAWGEYPDVYGGIVYSTTGAHYQSNGTQKWAYPSTITTFSPNPYTEEIGVISGANDDNITIYDFNGSAKYQWQHPDSVTIIKTIPNSDKILLSNNSYWGLYYKSNGTQVWKQTKSSAAATYKSAVNWQGSINDSTFYYIDGNNDLQQAYLKNGTNKNSRSGYSPEGLDMSNGTLVMTESLADSQELVHLDKVNLSTIDSVKIDSDSNRQILQYKDKVLIGAFSSNTNWELVLVNKTGNWTQEWSVAVSVGGTATKAAPTIGNTTWGGLSTQTATDSENLTFDVRNYFQPNKTYPYSVLYYNNSTGDTTDVTQSATLDIESVTLNGTQILTSPAKGELATINDTNVNATVNVTVEYDSLAQTEQIVIAAPTVKNLALLPDAFTRAQAVFGDSALFGLIVAALLSVAASRFVNAFAGLATAQVIIVIGWFAGYIGIGVAMLSVFTAIFLGLNLAENTVQLRGGQ